MNWKVVSSEHRFVFSLSFSPIACIMIVIGFLPLLMCYFSVTELKTEFDQTLTKVDKNSELSMYLLLSKSNRYLFNISHPWFNGNFI